MMRNLVKTVRLAGFSPIVLAPLLGIFALITGTGSASAAFITYQGGAGAQTSWQTAAGAGTEPLETFDGFTAGTMVPTLPGLGIGFEPIAAGLYPGVYQHGVDNTPSGPLQLSNMPSGTPNPAYQNADIVLYVLPGFELTAVGFWNGDPQAAMTGSVYDASDTLLGTFAAASPGNGTSLTVNFAGFTSDIAVHRIVIEGSVGDGYNHIDDLQTNAARIVTNGVPEPMTLSLLGAGLAGLSWVRRRRG